MSYTMPKALREIYGTEAGKYFFDNIRAAYVDPSSLADTPEKTYYLLGIKEFIQGLFLQMDVKNESITVEFNDND